MNFLKGDNGVEEDKHCYVVATCQSQVTHSLNRNPT